MRVPPRVAWAVSAAALALVANAVILVVTPVQIHEEIERDELEGLVGVGVAVVAASAVGAALLARAQRRPPPRPPVELSKRELQIVRLIAQGLSTKAIAAQLVLSPKTVDAHRVRIHRKLGVHDRVALTRLALDRGWVVEATED